MDADKKSRITEIVLAARSVGMSYGQYVQRTGGLAQPPEELVIETDPNALICRNCGKKFRSTSGHHRVYCTEECRIHYFRFVKKYKHKAANGKK